MGVGEGPYWKNGVGVGSDRSCRSKAQALRRKQTFCPSRTPEGYWGTGGLISKRGQASLQRLMRQEQVRAQPCGMSRPLSGASAFVGSQGSSGATSSREPCDPIPARLHSLSSQNGRLSAEGSKCLTKPGRVQWVFHSVPSPRDVMKRMNKWISLLLC